MTDEQKYPNWRLICATPYTDWAQDLVRQLRDSTLEVAAVSDTFSGWLVLAAPGDYERALSAVNEIKANGIRHLWTVA